MKRYISYTFVIALALTSGLVSCGKKGNGDAQASFDISVKSNGACADLSAFYNDLRKMPSDGWVRRHTVNMKADDRNTRVSNVVETGGSPRANFLSVLYYSNFEITEQSVPDFHAELEKVDQSGCESVTIGNQTYAVRESTGSSIRLAQMVQVKDRTDAKKMVPFEKESITYNFRGPRSVDITRRVLVQDPCPHYDTVFVTKTTRLTWGHSSDPAVDEPQEVNPAFVRSAMRAVYSLPPKLATIQTEGVDSVAMSIDDMALLRNSAVRRDMQVCPYRAKPPEGDDPEAPIEVATPTPTPAPEAAGTTEG